MSSNDSDEKIAAKAVRTAITNRRAVSRRQFFESSSAALMAVTLGSFVSFARLASAKGTDVIAGAIRWDAWYKQADSSIAAQHSLSSARYYKRAPFWCSVSADSQVDCTGTAAEMDREIHSAAACGLKYWAFDWYASDTSFRVAWNLYQQSPDRNLINWCGLVGLGVLGSVPFSNNKWQENMHEWAQYMQQPNYQKVAVGVLNRPLLYILWDDNQLKWYFGNDVHNLRKAIDFLSELLVHAGLHAPYVVILHGTSGASAARGLGGAISNYISRFKPEDTGPYLDLDRQTREFWKEMMDTGEQIVPIAMVGWDTRARQERPVPWDPATPNPNPRQYYALATPTELAAHLQAAVEFIDNHPTSCPSRVLLIYSWDECDEGGALVPTLGDPTAAYLTAIAPIIS